MHGNYSDESQEGADYKEKSEYKPPVIDKLGQANKLFKEIMNEIRRIKNQRINEM